MDSISHLTLEERRIIQDGIRHGSTKTAIAKTIGKDNSTIGKEIKAHRILVSKCNMALECEHYRRCKRDRECVPDCPEYKPFSCKRRDRSPGACNGCSNRPRCRFNKYDYNPEQADADYHTQLVDSRLGVNLSTNEAKAMADIIGPLLRNGLSPYHIVQLHPELHICEKTLYNYVEWGVFSEIAGINAIDFRRQTSRKLPKQKVALYKKRQDRKFLQGRLYKDYIAYKEENPDVLVTQMDTVYNTETNGPFIQTFKFMSGSILLALFHEEKTAASMVAGVNMLEEILGTALFRAFAHILLTDRGTEFSAASAMETAADGTQRTRVFYCDPMQSDQKGSLENNHIQLRYILPKSVDLRAMGLTDQNALNLVLSHVNSAPVQSLGGKSPLEATQFFYPELYARLTAFGIRQIDKDQIILKPTLLKRLRK